MKMTCLSVLKVLYKVLLLLIFFRINWLRTVLMHYLTDLFRIVLGNYVMFTYFGFPFSSYDHFFFNLYSLRNNLRSLKYPTCAGCNFSTAICWVFQVQKGFKCMFIQFILHCMKIKLTSFKLRNLNP